MIINIILNPWSMTIYMFAPFKSELYCQINYMVTTCVMYQIILLLDAIIIVKYVFIFHMKNPTALQDDFWKIFINVWILLLNLVLQTTYLFWPGRESVSIVLCSGKIPNQFLRQGVKRIYIPMLIIYFSTFLHISFWISNKLLKYFSSKKYNEYRQYENKWANVVTKENMFSLVYQIISFLFLVLSFFYIPDFVNRTYLPDLDHYPNYMIIFIRDLVLSSLCVLLFVILIFKRNEMLQKDARREIILAFNVFNLR
jgi:hypothetical protein